MQIHRDQLDPSDTMTRHGIRVTKPLRTLLDLATCLSQKELERAIRQAVYRKLTTTALLAKARSQPPRQARHEQAAPGRVHGSRIEADCVWREQRVIVELDGRDAHDSTHAFEADRARDAALVAAGWRVIRITSARVRRDGKQLANELRAILR